MIQGNTVSLSPGYLNWTSRKSGFLTHHAGYCYLNPSPYCACANVIQPYRTTFLWQPHQKKVQLNKLPQNTITFRIMHETIRFNYNAKNTNTRTWFNMCPSWRHLMTHWPPTFVLKCLTYTIFRTYVYSLLFCLCSMSIRRFLNGMCMINARSCLFWIP